MGEPWSDVGDRSPSTTESASPEGRRPAPLLVRIAARILDQFIYGVPVAVALVPLLIFAPEVDWLLLVAPPAAFGYFTLMESRTGSTVGKRACGLRVLGVEGSKPSLFATAKRNAWLLIGLVPLVGVPLYFVVVTAIVVTVHLGTEHRGVHDQVAGTSVVVG
jgi:uncharacterized RDD family membrane protein YckC